MDCAEVLALLVVFVARLSVNKCGISTRIGKVIVS